MKKLFLITLIFLAFAGKIFSQTEMYQSFASAKTLQSETMEKTNLPGLSYSRKTGTITNEDIAWPLQVFFCYRGGDVIDSSTCVLVPAGGSLNFATNGTALYRVSLAPDNGFKFSQVIIGTGAKLSGSQKIMRGKDYHGRDLTGQVFKDWDFTGTVFSESDLTGSVFINCIFEDCNFTDAIGITGSQLEAAARLKADGTGYSFVAPDSDTYTIEP